MSWEDPTPALIALRAMLVACAANVALEIGEERIHYPTLDLDATEMEDDEEVLANPLPAFELEDVGETPGSGIAGGGSLGGGSLAATLVAPSSWSIGKTQAHARLIARQLCMQETGLPIVSADAGEASEVTYTAEAGQAEDEDEEALPVQTAHRVCSIMLRYELSY